MPLRKGSNVTIRLKVLAVSTATQQCCQRCFQSLLIADLFPMLLRVDAVPEDNGNFIIQKAGIRSNCYKLKSNIKQVFIFYYTTLYYLHLQPIHLYIQRAQG